MEFKVHEYILIVIKSNLVQNYCIETDLVNNESVILSLLLEFHALF